MRLEPNAIGAYIVRRSIRSSATGATVHETEASGVMDWVKDTARDTVRALLVCGAVWSLVLVAQWLGLGA